ncbi:hemagglutinin repeat-containing protein [Pseudomonas extremaustralis]|uniref:hemagglutinin repeat-containing protein n=1 Tax=Pseudomonas extremaustralis TaxID=359110 RepID=UPI0028560C15|nr:hemagglutinin repeat-containing protein [Pseudomonas extremaustralis]MDR6576130.1 filamentous hemagglutinin [Pseudomonas extremaustralis]
MDVRQFAFLARQPSAALKSRSNFLGLPKRGLALVLANAMFWQPLLALADGIVVSAPGTTLGQAGNGVPIVNIAAPNGNGLSHNQFQDYNVGQQGVILNNATGRTQSTQLGGIILGNQNLNGTAASVILNEVNGGSPSQLRGYTEVAGQSAHVIVANPYGVTCDGCGFINTPQATLTTGKAVIENGQITRYQVDQGSVAIEGAGLNASNVDQFEIITRSAKINAEIQAKNLTIIAGANDVDAKTLKATARAADPASKPQLAIDSSALGGMYAGAIKLVSSEAGVGVKLDGKMVASSGDMQLDASGNLSLVDTAAAGAVNIKADNLQAKGPVYAGTTLDVKTQGDLTSQNNLVAKDRITLTSGGQLRNNGIIESGVNADNTRNATGDVSISAQSVNNTGKNIIASRDLVVNATQTLTNQGGTLSGQTTTLNAQTLDNQNNGRVLSVSALKVTADEVFNTLGVITSSGDLTANVGHLNNHNGELSSAGNTTVNASSLDNSDGQVTGDVALNIGLIGALNNQNGVLGSGQRVSITAASLDNSHNGSLVSDGGLTARIAGLFDNQNGDLSAKGAVDLQTGSLDNRNGSLSGKDRLTLRSDSLDNRTGNVRATNDLQLNVGQLDNRQKGLLNSQAAINFTGTQLDNRGGLLSAVGPMRLDAASTDNGGGRIASQTNLIANVAQFANQGGELVAQGALTLNGKVLDNRGGGLVGATKALQLNVDAVDNRGGEISSAVDVGLQGSQLNNSDNGKILAGTDLALRVAQIINQTKGQLFSKGATTVVGQSLDNSGGNLVTQQGLDIRLDNALSNVAGLISSEGTLAVNAGSLDSTGGNLSSAGALALTTKGVLKNQGGSISTDGTLTLNSAILDNSRKGQISGKNATVVTTGVFDNTQAGQLISGDTLDLSATQVSNGVASRIASDKALTASVTGFDQQGGQLFSKTSLSLDLNQGQLNNQNGLINAPLLMLKNLKDINNQGGEISSAQAFALDARNLDNGNGKLISNQGLTLRLEQWLTSVKGLISAQSLDLQSARLDNTGGLISSRGTLGVTVGGQVVNQGGTLIADGDMQISADSLDNSDGGQVVAQGALALTVDHVINRAKGLLSGKTDLTLIGQDLDNSGGSLLSQKNLKAGLSGDLTNSQGLLSAEGRLDVTAASLSNTLGSLSAAGPLTLTTTGVVLNQGGVIVTDAGLVLNSASLDNSNKGSISSKGAVRVNTGVLDNSHNGRLNSGDTLDLTATQLTNQDSGRIASSGALTASVTGLDQQGGQLFSNTALTLDVNRGQLNNQNGLISAPLLMLKNLTDINNDGGEISSVQAFNVTARSLNNSNGKLLSNQALTLRVDQALTNLKGLIAAATLDVKAGSLDNSGGTLTSRANLDVNLDGLLNNQNKGLINATNGLTINSRGINNQSGSLLGSAIAIDFGAATADLDNSGGLITTAGVLSIQHLRDLSNRNGEISSTQSLDLSTRALDNTGGKLISSNVLTVNADAVQNLGGLLSGWQGLSLTSNNLDNRNKGTLSSRDGDVSVALSGAVLNSGEGAIVSRKNLSLNAVDLDNSNGGVISSGGAQTLTLSGLLTNAQGGLIDSDAALVIQAMTLGNAGGTVNAQQGLSFTGTALDNTGGNLVGNAAVTLDLLGVLTNTNGKLASVGPLRVQRSTQIDNQGGQLASQGLMTLLTGGLDNRNRGTVAANDLLTIITPGVVQNDTDGLIYSQSSDLQVQAGSLSNGKGTLQSQGALTLTTGADINNQSGRIIAKTGDLTVSAGNVDNRGGVLSSLQSAFTAQLTGVLKNGYDLNNNRQGGVTQAQRLNLTALGGIDNYGGRVSAQSGDAIITTGNFDNRNGGLYAKGKINVTGSNFDNSGDNDGQIAGQQIDLNLSGALNNRLGIIESDSTLAIKAASLDNQTGQLRVLGGSGKTDFQIGGLFDNRNGTLESANTNLSLAAGGFLNDGGSLLHVGDGTFDISTANVTGAGGSIVTRGGLTLNADSWSNSNVIQAARLNVNVNNFTQTASGQLLASTSLVGSGGNWTNDGLIASDGALNLNLGGTYAGNGRLSSLGTLGLSAGQVSLNAASSIAGGGDTTVSVGGQLNNVGRLTSATNLIVNAGGINNQGTLGSGQGLTVTTGALVNDHGLIFSGADMSLRLDTLNNSYADIYSLGNLSIDRDGQGGLATSVINSSSSIQSDGNLSLAASTLQNVRAVLTTSAGGIYTASITEYPCIESPNYAGDCSGKQNHLWQIDQREKLEVTAASAGSSITAGKNLNIAGGDVLNASSTIGAAGNLNITANNLTNSGVETGETETWRLFVSERTRNAGMWYDAAAAFNNRYAVGGAGYNPKDLSGLVGAMSSFIGMTEQERTVLRRVTKISTGDQTYAAVIQAAGAVNIKAQDGIDNRVARPGFTYVGAGAKTTTGSAGASGAGAFSTRVTVNQQLPPNLAQQQVNPLTLPGFALPTGQNGLFRLSGQGSSTPVASGPQSWTMGSASVSPTQRQQVLPSVQPPNIQLGNDAQAAASGVDLTAAGHQASNVNVGASAINVSPPAASAEGSALPGRSTAFTINRVQGLPASSGQSTPHKYLIETNPVLTDLKQFMSSDYLLSNLGYNPDQSAKRLGDGFYEQNLIQQAVVARTGQRFIDGQTSDEGMFKYLMNNAVASKQELNLQLGVSLTSEQVAALTHDIVWMENAEVNGEQVLVPVLYLANANNRLAANGALIQGSDVTLIAGKDLSNAGTLKASNNLSATAGNDLVNSGLVEAGNRLDLLAGNNLINKAGGIIAGRDVSLTAGRDVINERTVTTHESGSSYRTERTDFVDNAARIEAANGLTVNAGRDVNNTGGVLKSGTDTTISAGRDVNLVSAEQVTSGVRGLYTSQAITQYGSTIDAGQDLKVSAGRDVTAIASQLAAKRDVSMSAVGDLTLASAADEQHSYGKTKKVTSQEDHVQQVSTTVTAGGNVALSASQDLLVSASRVSAGKEAYLYAGNDLDLNAAQNSDYSYYRKTKTSSGLLSSSQKTRIDSSSSITQQGSSISADTVVVRAGRDIGTTASDVVSTNATSLIAGRNVVIDGATETFEESHSTSSKKSGLLGTGGIGFTIGSSSLQNTSTSTTESSKASTIGSVLGSVDIQAGKDLTIKGSDVIAGKDINLIGQNVNIIAAENNNKSEQTSKSKSGGLTLALSGTVGSAVDTAYQTAKQAKQEDDSRVSALQGIKAGLTGVQAWQAAQQNGGMTADNAGQFVGISISLGAQKSSSKQTQEQTISQGSSLTSGNNLSIVAVGNGTPGVDGDIHVQGSSLKAVNDISLAAERDIRLEAAANSQKLDGKNNSGGGAIGISLGVGPQGGGLSIFANANKGTGNEKGTGTTWTETTLDAGHQANLVSGRDTALKGAQVSADKIAASVGRDLTLQSLQDTDNYKSKQTDVSGGVSVAIIGTGGSASLSVSQTKIDSKYQSVQEQTGLYAGKGGYQVDVVNHTQLDGSVIASTAEADKNRLSTGTLGWSDIKNEAEYKSQMQSASVSSSSDGSGGFTSNMPSGTLIAYNHSGSASGTTSSAVSNGTLDIRDPAKQQQDVATLSHDVEHANDSISPIFDKEKEQKRLQQVRLISEIGTQSMDIIRTQGAINAAKAQKDPAAIAAARDKLIAGGNTDPTAEQIATQITNTVMQQYGTGSDYQRAAQAVTAALQGLAGGNIAQALTGAAAPYLAEQIHSLTADNPEANLMAHAVLGALVAQAQGNSALAGAAGASVGELIARQLYPDKKTADLTESERQTVSALSSLAGGLAGAITGGGAAGAVTGAGTAQNAVDNNFLNQGRPDAYAARYAGCKGETGCELTVRKDIAKESAENINKLKGCWDAGDTVCVAKMREQIETDRNAYTKLKTQDAMVGGAYEQVAEFYADVIDNCGGKCEWLEAALKKTIGDGINMAAYAVLGGGGVPRGSTGAAPGEKAALPSSPQPAPLISDLGSNYRVITPRGPGAAEGPLPPGYTPVSRWVSPEEVSQWMQNGGAAIPNGVGAGGRVYVTTPGAAKPGGTGPIRIDFAVPEKAISQGGKPEWGQIFQPNQSSPIYNVKINVPDGIKIPGVIP